MEAQQPAPSYTMTTETDPIPILSIGDVHFHTTSIFDNGAMRVVWLEARNGPQPSYWFCVSCVIHYKNLDARGEPFQHVRAFEGCAPRTHYNITTGLHRQDAPFYDTDRLTLDQALPGVVAWARAEGYMRRDCQG